MTYEELRKAEELKKDIENLKECVDYFSPVTNGTYFSCRKKLATNKFPFWFRLSKKDNKTANCELHIQGYGGGKPIWVDKEFVDYCKVYFENKLKEAEKEFSKFTTRSDNNAE